MTDAYKSLIKKYNSVEPNTDWSTLINNKKSWAESKITEKIGQNMTYVNFILLTVLNTSDSPGS